jgi:hypothetical protein
MRKLQVAIIVVLPGNCFVGAVKFPKQKKAEKYEVKKQGISHKLHLKVLTYYFFLIFTNVKAMSLVWMDSAFTSIL